MKIQNIKTFWSFLTTTVLAGTAFAQSGGSFDLSWHTIDGGGILNSGGGTYTVSGTVGQPNAGKMRGGNYTIDGGFWGFGTDVQVPPLQLTITHSAGNVVICWPSHSTGFVLQESTSLTAPNWTAVPQTPTDNGTTKCVTLPISPGTKFFRLKKN